MLPLLKNSLLLIFIFVFCSSLTSCEQLFTNYLRKDSKAKDTTPLSSEYKLRLYADSLNALLPVATEEKSMIYSIGDYSFQISKFLHNGKPILYVERGDSGEYGTTLKKYYVKNNKLVYVVEDAIMTLKTKPYSTTKAYYTNDYLYYAEQKEGLNLDSVKAAQFIKTDVKLQENHSAKLPFFEDALNQRGKFDLVFEGITECTKAKYLILSKEGINSFRAPVRVQNEDEFIRELASNPLRYRGEKLDLTWNTNDSNEVVYINGKLKSRN